MPTNAVSKHETAALSRFIAADSQITIIICALRLSLFEPNADLFTARSLFTFETTFFDLGLMGGLKCPKSAPLIRRIWPFTDNLERSVNEAKSMEPLMVLRFTQ